MVPLIHTADKRVRSLLLVQVIPLVLSCGEGFLRIWRSEWSTSSDNHLALN
jgi:hypothetical protein